MTACPPADRCTRARSGIIAALLPGHARSAAHLRAITTLTHEAIMSILRTLNPTVASLLLAFSAARE